MGAESGVGERVERRVLTRCTELSLDGGELVLLLLVESRRRRAERTERMLSAHKAGVTGHLVLGRGRVGLVRVGGEGRGELAGNGEGEEGALLVIEGRRNRNALVVGLLGHLLLVELERHPTAQLRRRLALLGKVVASVGVARRGRGGRGLDRSQVEVSRRFDGRRRRGSVVEAW